MTLCPDNTGGTWTTCPARFTRCPYEKFLCEKAPKWDLNLDHTTNVLDMLQVRNDLRKDPLLNGVLGDTNSDGKINILDLINVRNHLGETW